MWFSKKKIDVLAIGDVFIDTFIELEDAKVTCDIDHENCTISMRFGDKIPYKKATPIAGVGNAGNAAVSAARLGVASALLTCTGTDTDGEKIRKQLTGEGIADDFMNQDAKLPTNNAYVLQYGAERTILVKQEAYEYHVPAALSKNPPVWIYLTSLGSSTESFHHEFATWITAHPETKLAFQPGTFQMKLGKETLADIYKATTLFICNKEEAQRILGLPNADFPELHTELRKLGPKLVIITDGPKGLTASDDAGNRYFLPMYPDPAEPVSRTGAGDATASTITVALSLGIPFDQALLWGPINSMNVVQHIGAQTGLLSKEKILEYLKNAPESYRLTKTS